MRMSNQKGIYIGNVFEWKKYWFIAKNIVAESGDSDSGGGGNVFDE